MVGWWSVDLVIDRMGESSARIEKTYWGGADNFLGGNPKD
jgi:hypothetical protein